MQSIEETLAGTELPYESKMDGHDDVLAFRRHAHTMCPEHLFTTHLSDTVLQTRIDL